MTEIEPFVDAGRAAGFLGMTRRRVLKMSRAGEIPAHPIGHGTRRTWRYRLTELVDAVVTRKVDTPTRKRAILDASGPAVPKRKGH